MAAPDVLDSPGAGGTAIRGALLRAVGYVLTVALSVLAAALALRHLGVVDFGRYVVALSLVGMAGGITDAGLTAVGTREWVKRSGADRETFMRNLLGMRLALTLAAVAAVTLFATAAGYESALIAGTAAAGVALLAQVHANTLTVPLAADLRLGWVTAADVTRQVVLTGLIVVLVAADAGVLPLLAAAVPASIVSLALVVALVRSTAPILPRYQPAVWREVIADVLPVAAATAIAHLYLRIGIVLMSLTASGLETGYYGTAFRITEVLVWIPGLLVTAAFPILARAGRDDAERLRYGLQRLLEVGVTAGLAMVLAIGFGAPVAIEVLEPGGAADPAIEVLRIQGIALVATFVVLTCQFGLLSLHRHRALLTANAIALGVAIVLVLVLSAAEGARGAAAAAVIGELVLAALVIGALRRDIPLRLGTAPRSLLAAVVAGGAAALTGLPAVPASAIAIALYVGGLVALRAFPHDVTDAVLRRGGPAARTDRA